MFVNGRVGREHQAVPVGSADGCGTRTAMTVEEHDRGTGANAQHGLQVVRYLAVVRTGVCEQIFGCDQTTVNAEKKRGATYPRVYAGRRGG